MIRLVETKKDLNRFVYFIKDLYKDDPFYVYPIFMFYKKELKEIVLDKKTSKAIVSLKDGKVVGRLMFTYEYSKRQGKKICYYSNFDSINDPAVSRELFHYMETDMRKHNITYSEGTFNPDDPDTRRGIMVKGFNELPALFTSYNYEYYSTLLEDYGFTKAVDTVSVNAFMNEKSHKKVNTLSKYFLRRHDVRIDSLNFRNLDQDLIDIEKILKEATNEIVYQDAPSMEMIEATAKQMKQFINPNFVKIARENGTNKPIAFFLCLPDLNQIFVKTKGRFRPLKTMYLKNKVTRAFGKLQYIVPEYQNTGLIGHIFKVLYDEFKKAGILTFEAGTMMEDNPKAINTFMKFDGEIIKIYRLYGKELSK